MWQSASIPMTRPIGGLGPTGSTELSGVSVVGLSSDWSAYNPINFRVQSIWPGRFLRAGLPVCIGGFHVSGSIAMLPEMPGEMREAAALGISFFAAEGGARPARSGDPRCLGWRTSALRFYERSPSLEGEPAPILPRRHVRRVSGQLSSLDLGRGCPYQCSFRSIINVQGRKSRFRSPDDLERAIRENYRRSNRRFFITDDNFARNRHWEPLFDRMISCGLGRA
jgi:hypothetical protein